MIISTTITRNKKPSQAVYQMANPEPPVQNEPIVDSKVVLGDDKLDEIHENSDQVNPIGIGSSEDSMNVKKENETGIDSESDQNASIEEDESFESEQEPEQSFQEEQPQIEKTEEAPKKKTSSKKK